MIELSIKYLSSCALTEEHESMQAAADRITQLFETYQCFYRSTQGLRNKKELVLFSVPSLANDVVFQVLMPPDMQRTHSGYATNDKILVIFRAREK